MSETSQAGILLGSAVLFVIIWEIRSVLGILAGFDTHPVIYGLATLTVVGLVAIGLNLGLIHFGDTVDETN